MKISFSACFCVSSDCIEHGQNTSFAQLCVTASGNAYTRWQMGAIRAAVSGFEFFFYLLVKVLNSFRPFLTRDVPEVEVRV